jgi:pimeloyl-ACP methyl ester carboxylesterase
MTSIAPTAGGLFAPAGVAQHRIDAGGLDMFYLDAPGGAPALLCLHGLSANAHSFGGVIAAGLAPEFRVVAPDQRGRARTAKPDAGYAIRDHARDAIALLDRLGLDRVVLVGHSFGGYLSIWLAANHPDRVEKLVVIDAAINTDPRIGAMLKPSLDRLTHVAPSADAYIAEIRAASYLQGMWDQHVESYYRAELVENADGTAQSATSASAIHQTMMNLGCEPWLHHVQQVRQPALVINALGAFGPPGSPPLLDELTVRATANAFRDGRYVVTPGNHLTMMFGDGALAIAREIRSFVRGDAAVPA